MPTNGSTYYIEITKLVKDINNILGEGVDEMDEANEDEFVENDWRGRCWKVGDSTFNLVIEDGHLFLYSDLGESKKVK